MPSAIGQLPATQEHAPTSRVIVEWEHPAPPAELRAGPRLEAVRAAGGARARFVRVTGSGAAVYDLGRKVAGRGTDVLSRLSRMPGAVSVSFDQWIPVAAALPNDTHAASQWGLLGPSNGSTYGIDVLPAWDTADGDGVVVAVVDSGVVDHPDLAGQTVPGYDFIDGDADATDTGACTGSHGTVVTGPIAAIANNAAGIFGGAPGAKVQPVRVSACGGGWSTTSADGMRWAAGAAVPGVPANATPADIINASFGVPDAPFCLPEYASAIADARERGVIIVVAAGNGDVDASTMSPGNCAGVVNVAAVDDDGRRSSFSNYGASIDLAAPGQGIWTTTNTGTGGEPNATYGHAAGTSVSAPHVAAAAAIVRSAHPAFSHDAVELVLVASALPPAADATETGCAARGCGAGIVNAARAMQRLAPAEPPVAGFVSPSRRYPLPGQTLSVLALSVDGVGVAGAEVRIGSGAWQPMSAVDGAFGGSVERVQATLVAPSTEGTHAVCVRAGDGVNGVGIEGCTSVLVDAGPPSISSPALSASSVPGGTAVSFTTTASDVNGVRGAEYSIDGGPWIPMRPADGGWGATSEASGSTVNERVAQLAVGGDPCVVMASGRVRCWGHNYYGTVGDGTLQNRSVPVDIGLDGVTDIGAGGSHACAVLEDATVQCWGANWYGQIGDGTRKHKAAPVPVAGLSDVAAVAPGYVHTCALRNDATVWCWGPALGLGDGTEPPAVRPEPGQVAELAEVVQVMSGGSNFGSSCALLAAGTVRCWGDNAYGSLGDGSTTHRWTPVAVSGLSGVDSLSGMHQCATLATEQVMCWGPNWYGQLGDGTTTQRLVPTALTVLPDVEAIASGQGHKCAIVPDATVRCWGNNSDGQLGDGSFTNSMTPRTAVGLTGIIDIRAGWDVTCALRDDGSVWCWGWNEHGQLGDGSTAVHATPVRAAGLGGLAEGPHSICVRATDGAGRTSTASACSTLTITDTSPPAATITTPGPYVGASFASTLTFSEAVVGVQASDFALSGTATCSVGTPAGSGATYSVPVSCSSGGTVTLTLNAGAVSDLAGQAGPMSSVSGGQVTVDRTAPTAGAPRHSLPAGTGVRTGGKVYIDLAWSGSDSGAGIRSYDVRMRTGSGAWRTIATGVKKTTLRTLAAAGQTHRFSVRATDKVGNVGSWTDGPKMGLTARQESHASIAYSGTWHTRSSTSYWGGQARSTTTPGSRVSMTFTGRSIAVVASRGPDSGWVHIRINGTLVAELDLYASTRQHRRVVWTSNWSTSAERTITIRVLDSPGRTRLDLDAFVVAS